MGKSSKAPTKTSSTQTNVQDVSPTLQPYINDILSRGQQQLDYLLGTPGRPATSSSYSGGEGLNLGSLRPEFRTGGTNYDIPAIPATPGQNLIYGDPSQPGVSRIAQFDPLQLESQDQQLNFARTGLTPYIQGEQNIREQTDPTLSYLKGLITDFNPNDPIIQNLIEASINPVRREFTETTLPRLGASEQQLQGGPGGTRGGIIASQLGQRYLQDVGNLSSNIIGQQQQFHAQNALSAAGQQYNILNQLLPESLKRQLVYQQLGPEILNLIGGQKQGLNQANINAQREYSDERIYKIFDVLQRQANLVGGLPGGTTGTNTSSGTSTNPGGRSPFASSALGGLGGAASGAAIGTAVGSPGIGTGIGALLGLLFGGA